jgi:hypothetical protein
MPNAKIKIHSKNEVSLTFTDVMGVRNTRVFYTPYGGGYIRDSATNNQICEELYSTGSTLWAKDIDDLLRVIRREWKRRRNSDKTLLF